MRTRAATLLVTASLVVVAGAVGWKVWPRPPRATTRAKSFLNPQRPLTAIIGPNIDKDLVSIRVDKSSYTLTVCYRDKPVKSYPVVLGTNPVDDKRREGDRCTPEGVFHVRDLYPHNSWAKFIWLDYPTRDSWAKHRRAKRDGKIADGATIGGEIGIHGVPEGSDYLVRDGINWTHGCVSVSRADIEEIYAVTQRGTKVTIAR